MTAPMQLSGNPTAQAPALNANSIITVAGETRATTNHPRCCCQYWQHHDSCAGDDALGAGGTARQRDSGCVASPALDQYHDCDGLYLDGRARIRGGRLVCGVPDAGYRAAWQQHPLFRICELHDPWVRGHHPNQGMAIGRTDNGDEWRAAVRMVDGCYFRGAAKSNDARCSDDGLRLGAKPLGRLPSR